MLSAPLVAAAVLCCSIGTWPPRLSATLISNVNLVFETFDPVSMVRFFEFNDKGWNISGGCIQDMFYYLDGLHRDVGWAMRLYDASGYYAGGLLDGNHIRTGNPAVCRRLNAEHRQRYHDDDAIASTSPAPPPPASPVSPTVVHRTERQRQRPASGASTMRTAPIDESGADGWLQPFAVQLVSARYSVHMDAMIGWTAGAGRPRSTGDLGGSVSQRIAVQQTVCMPLSCDFDDLKQVMSYAHLPHMRNAVHVHHAELASLRLLGGGGDGGGVGDYAVWTDLSFYVLGSITAMIIALMFIAAICEHCAHKSPKRPKPPPADAPKPERFAFAAKTSFIAHVDIDKISKLSASDTESTLSRNLNAAGDQLLDSLIVNNFGSVSAHTYVEKQDNIVQARSLELEQQQQHKPGPNGPPIKDTSADSVPTSILTTTSTVVPKPTAADIDASTDECLLAELIGAFSWQRNLNRLFVGDRSTRADYDVDDGIDDDVRVVSALKVLCCLAIMLVHVCVFLVHISSNKRYANDEPIVATLLANGSVTIDVFFFLSGISMAHVFYTTARVIDVHQICGAFDQLLLFASMVLYKLIRLTFPYLVVLIGLQLTMKHYQSTAVLEIPSEDHATCQEHMWKNILYIDTFFPVTERCMVWSWYISLEAQLCLGASIILLLAQTHPRYASVICASFFTSSIVTSTMLRYNQQQQQLFGKTVSASSVSQQYERDLVAFNGVYDQPWTRISPYLLGLCLGYILHRSQRSLRMHISVVFLGWLACVCLLVGFALKQLFVGKLSQWLRAGLAATTHTVWSMILFWVVLASVSQHGGRLGRLLLSPHWRALGKLTNCVLLVHPLVTRWMLLSLDHSVHVSDSLLAIVYAGLVVVIYAVAFVLYMLFEAPFAAVFHILYNRNFK